MQVQEGVAPLHALDARLQLGRQRGAHAAGRAAAHRPAAHGRVDELARAPQVGVADDGLARQHAAAIGGGHAHAAARLLVDEQLRHVRVQVEVRALVLGHAAHERRDDGLRAALGEVKRNARPVEVAQHVPTGAWRVPRRVGLDRAGSGWVG